MIDIKPFTVPPSFRTSILPQMSDNYINLETYIYNLAGKHSPTYKGGQWEFVRPAPLTFFMHPTTPRTFEAFNPDNWFEGQLTNVEFGIGITLMALSRISIAGAHRGRQDLHAISSHITLMDWAKTADLSSEFWAFID